MLFRHPVQALTQALIGAYSACNNKPLTAGLLQCAPALDLQGIDNRILERTRDISAQLVFILLGCFFLVLCPGIQCEGLQTAETEIKARPVSHRTRKFEHVSTTAFSQFGQYRPTRLTKPHHLCRFIEGFTRCIIKALANDLVAADGSHVSQ